jgi:response regulator RpfG family c-di-GMP phosphodiesterase
LGETDHPERDISIGRIAIMEANQKLLIALYSDDSTVRASVKSALGKRISKDLPENEIKEFATAAALRLFVDSKKVINLFILDGEAVPEGGMGVARQLKDEVFNCPPVLLITGRAQDNWLATWSRAEATVTHPIDPFTLARKCAEILKSNIDLNLSSSK